MSNLSSQHASDSTESCGRGNGCFVIITSHSHKRGKNDIPKLTRCTFVCGDATRLSQALTVMLRAYIDKLRNKHGLETTSTTPEQALLQGLQGHQQ